VRTVENRDLTAEELEGILTWSVVRVARFTGQRLADRLAAHRLNPIQFGVLAYLQVEGEMTQADLARAVLVRPQSVAALVEGMERRGLVRRTGERVRGRRNPIGITEAGRAALRAVRPVALASNDLSDAGLSLAESAELNRLLGKVLAATRGRTAGGRRRPLEHPRRLSGGADGAAPPSRGGGRST
jgi:DNA-binding MarR family transcriptional regulator